MTLPGRSDTAPDSFWRGFKVGIWWGLHVYVPAFAIASILAFVDRDTQAGVWLAGACVLLGAALWSDRR